MAGDWIKMRTSLGTHPQVVRISSALKADRLRVIGGLHAVWSLFDTHSEDGTLPGYSLWALDDAIGWQGFGAALALVGWVIEEEDAIRAVDFEEHNGQSAKRRAMETERKRKERAEAEASAKAARELSASEADEKRSREEKRREEKNITPPTTSNEVVVAASYAGDVQNVVVKPECPHKQIIGLYHEILPMCPQVRDWTAARQQQLRARWNEDEARQNLDYWRRFFEYVKTCGFLVGIQPNTQRRPFFADLEWLTKSANFTKIRERKYES